MKLLPVAAIVLSLLPLPALAQNHTRFNAGVANYLQTEPQLEGDAEALRLFAAMNDEDKLRYYRIGEIYCEGRRKGLSDKDITNSGIRSIYKGDTTDDVKAILTSLYMASYNSAKYSICPEFK